MNRRVQGSEAARITHLAWGHIEVHIQGRTLRFKDCKVWPGGAVKWDWQLTGTHHQPGIQLADIAEILDQGVEVLVLSRGMQLRLHTSPEVEKLLRAQNIEFHILETSQAVEMYNQLAREGKNVGGIFHSTC
jgi:hypothetical protein